MIASLLVLYLLIPKLAKNKEFTFELMKKKTNELIEAFHNRIPKNALI